MPDDWLAQTPTRASKRQQLPEEVAAYVRELIVSGSVRPGEYLRMEPIAEAVGVSNTPVREGLLALQSEGFVRLMPRRGFVVAPFTRQDVRDLFWAQAQLAGELTVRAAKRISTEDLDALERNIHDYDRAIKNRDLEELGRLGHQFHRIVNLAGDSHRLALLLGSVAKHLSNRFYAAIEGRVDATDHDHPLILEELRQRNGRRARTLMETHIASGADSLIDDLERRGFWDAAEESAS